MDAQVRDGRAEGRRRERPTGFKEEEGAAGAAAGGFRRVALALMQLPL